MIIRPVLHKVNKRGRKGKQKKKSEQHRDSQRYKLMVAKGLR